MRGRQRDVVEDVGQEGHGQVGRLEVHVEGEVALVAEAVLQRQQVGVGGHDVAQPPRHARVGGGHPGGGAASEVVLVGVGGNVVVIVTGPPCTAPLKLRKSNRHT